MRYFFVYQKTEEHVELCIKLVSKIPKSAFVFQLKRNIIKTI